MKGVRSSIAALFLLAAEAGCDRPSMAGANGGGGPPAHPVPVAVVRPERKTLRRLTIQPGHLEPLEEAPLYARIAGYVEKVQADIGDRVKAGQLLAQLSVPEMEEEAARKHALVIQAAAERSQAEAAVKAAEAGVKTGQAKLVEAQAAVKRSDADLDRWRSELARIEVLGKERAIQERVVEETRSQFRSAEAAGEENAAKVDSARALIVESEARLAKAQADVTAAAARVEVAEADERRERALLGYARITAPFDGVVSQRGVDPGHLAGTAGQKEPLFTVVRSDTVRVFVNVPEREAVGVAPGARASVRIEALGDREIEGTVARSSWALDPTARTLRTEIDVPNTDGKLRPGMYASASIVLVERPDALTIPSSAVVQSGREAYCVVVSGGKAARRTIATGLSEGDRTEVLTGLVGDEQVVQAGGAGLKVGQPVEPAPAGKP
jgi:HlyD family secretion protein